MLRPLHILKRLAALTLGVTLAAGAQTQPSKSTPQAPAKKAPPAAAPAKAPTKAPAAAPAKAPTKAPTKAPAKGAAPSKAAQAPKPAAPKSTAAQKPKPSKPPKAPAKAAAEPKKGETPTVASVAGKRRDPFLALVSVLGGGGGPVRLPPGKAGLQVSTLRVDGVVRSQNGMIALVTNPQGRTYFLRLGDRLFDGRVEQISMDAVTFQETGKDPFGKPIERTVVKRIYPSAGEQQ